MSLFRLVWLLLFKKFCFRRGQHRHHSWWTKTKTKVERTFFFLKGWCTVLCDNMLPDKQLKTFHSRSENLCGSSWAFFPPPNGSLVKHSSDLYVLSLNSKTYLLLGDRGNYSCLFDVQDLEFRLRAKTWMGPCKKAQDQARDVKELEGREGQCDSERVRKWRINKRHQRDRQMNGGGEGDARREGGREYAETSTSRGEMGREKNGK